MHQLLSEEKLEDHRLSQILPHLISQADFKKAKDPLLQSLWLQRLPPHLQAILQTQSSLPVEVTTETAERILDIPFFPKPSRALVHSLDPLSSSPAASSSLKEQIQELCCQVAELHVCLPSTGLVSSHFPRRRTCHHSENQHDSSCPLIP